MKKHFILNGKQGAGKDAFKSAMQKYAKVYSISTVDVPKSVAKSLGWNGEKTDKNRNMLSDFKDWWSKYFDGSYNYVKRELEKFMESSDEIFTVDSREPEEIQRLVNDFGFETILVERHSVTHTASNHADMNVYGYHNYDYTIYNDGSLEDLDVLAKAFVDSICKE